MSYKFLSIITLVGLQTTPWFADAISTDDIVAVANATASPFVVTITTLSPI